MKDIGVVGAHDEEDLRPFLVGFFALPGGVPQKRKKKVKRSIVHRLAKTNNSTSFKTIFFFDLSLIGTKMSSPRRL